MKAVFDSPIGLVGSLAEELLAGYDLLVVVVAVVVVVVASAFVAAFAFVVAYVAAAVSKTAVAEQVSNLLKVEELVFDSDRVPKSYVASGVVVEEAELDSLYVSLQQK